MDYFISEIHKLLQLPLQGAFCAVKTEYIRRGVKEIFTYWRTIIVFGVLV
jgi:hypothetical protein